MTKVATIDTRRFLALLLITAMLIAMIPISVAMLPGGVKADVYDNISATFILGNSAPSITSVDLYTDNTGTTASSMTPQVEYIAKVAVTDANGLSDLSTCNITIFWDSSTDNVDHGTSDNYSDRASVLHTVGGSSWIMSAGTSTTWTVPSGSEEVSLTGTSFVFCFHFKPGECARESTDWNIVARVADSVGASAEVYDTTHDYPMNWYGRIVMNTTTVSWSGVSAGQQFTDVPAKQTNISVKYVANGNYDRAVTAESSWNGKNLNISGTPSANEFSLKADDDTTYGDLTDTPVVTATAGNCVIGAGTQTTESGDTIGTNTLYLSLGSPFTNGSYTGKVYFHLRNV